MSPQFPAHNAGDKLSPPLTGAGFTLIEMVGILAILSILATIIISTTTRSLDFAAANLESTNLVNFATALQNSILRNRSIPGANNWVQTIATELGASPFMVNTNALNSRRVLMIDPNNTLSLPYTQTGTGTGSTVPPTVRLMILSTLGPAFPNSLVDGTTTDFSTIWNTPDGAFPAVSGSNPLNSWSGKGSDLKVQRLDLGGAFVHLVLWDYPPPSPLQGKYQIDYQGTTNVVLNSGTNTYFLKNTVLSLLNNQGANQVDQILSRDGVFFYIQTVWRGTLDLGQGLGQGSFNITEDSRVAGAFAGTAAAFIRSPEYTNATGNPQATPTSVLSAMTSFMVAYTNYASAGGFPPALKNNAQFYEASMFTAMTNLCNPNSPPTPGACRSAPTP